LECDNPHFKLHVTCTRLNNGNAWAGRRGRIDAEWIKSHVVDPAKTWFYACGPNALVEFASGAQGAYTQVFYTRRNAAERGAKISGYLGTLEFDWYTSELTRVRHHLPFSDTIKGAEGMSHFGGDFALVSNFLDLLRGQAASKTPIWTGLQSVYACLAAKESSETGQFVTVRQVGASA
jgi:hypothetical protein